MSAFYNIFGTRSNCLKFSKEITWTLSSKKPSPQTVFNCSSFCLLIFLNNHYTHHTSLMENIFSYWRKHSHNQRHRQWRLCILHHVGMIQKKLFNISLQSSLFIRVALKQLCGLMWFRLVLCCFHWFRSCSSLWQKLVVSLKYGAEHWKGIEYKCTSEFGMDFFRILRNEIWHLQFHSTAFDLTTRQTLWNSVLGMLVMWGGYVGLNQSCVQRIVALPSINHARRYFLNLRDVGQLINYI